MKILFESLERRGLKGKVSRYNLIIPLLIILSLMTVMVVYTSRLIRRVTVANIHEVGDDKASSIAAQLENYLDTTKSVLWVTADTVDHMIRNGSTAEQILQYITEESEKQENQFDENYTGIYGYIMGEYLDGVGWEPPEGYDSLERDWYLSAIEAGGEPIIVSPYVDAQTHAVIISFSRMLSSGKDVLSMDVMMNRIQEMIRGLQIKGKGYGFIVNEDGMIIAHNDDTLNGTYLTETDEYRSLMKQVTETKNGNFEIMLGGEKSTVFVNHIMDQWFVVIAVSNQELYAEIWEQLTVNVLICIVIFALIAFFYYLGHKNEQNYSRRMEEMKIEEQKKAYETRVLKLEKEAADNANKAKSDFLAEMSHEIRTPINAVLGMNEMIMRESSQALEVFPPEREAAAFTNINMYAGNIESAGNNLLSIINDILDFSKIEAGRMDIVEGNYKLSSLLNDISNTIFFRANEKGIDFRVDVDETIPDGLCGDKVRIRQVITNLLGNAVKYTDHGSVLLKIRSKAESVEIGKTITLVISVKDTGIGIREEDIKKLFVKFQRVDLKRNSTVEGAGLGLAITQSLLAMMGGEIHVESVYGKGSEFTICVPQKITSCEPVGNFKTKFSKNKLGIKAYHESFRAPDARILIVDDTRMNLTVAIGLLKKTELQIDAVLSGPDAIEYARTTPYDLILMDQRMPKMDGTEALRHIREQYDGLNRETPVICLTADAVFGAKEHYLAEGFTDYLTKPIDSRALERMLMEYLPKEKVILVDDEDQSDHAFMEAGVQGRYEPLRTALVQPETGLRYCQGDEAFYQSVLRDYAQSAEKKAVDMEQDFNKENWKDYAILVHSLKSTSRTIGAQSLSEEAAELEAAANRGDAGIIREKHPDLMNSYKEVVRAIGLVLEKEETVKETAEDTDGEILEFFPDTP